MSELRTHLALSLLSSNTHSDDDPSIYTHGPACQKWPAIARSDEKKREREKGPETLDGRERERERERERGERGERRERKGGKSLSCGLSSSSLNVCVLSLSVALVPLNSDPPNDYCVCVCAFLSEKGGRGVKGIRKVTEVTLRERKEGSQPNNDPGGGSTREASIIL